MKNTRFGFIGVLSNRHPQKRMVVISGALALITAQQLSAIMLVDRGLPTANLNNAAGVDRSNVDWGSTTGISLVGDTFMNTSSNTWNISSIRLWTDGVAENPPGQPVPILWGGVDAGPITVVASSGALTSTTYLGGQGYQASGGSFYQLFQIDFAVSISLAPGQTYSFFLDGFDPSYPPYIFAEASNALLSGSLQQQADGLMLQADVNGNVLGNVQTWTSDSNVSSVSPNGGWDKSSDVNVQVFGSVPDGGTTLVLLGGALTGLGALRRQFRR